MVINCGYIRPTGVTRVTVLPVHLMSVQSSPWLWTKHWPLAVATDGTSSMEMIIKGVSRIRRKVYFVSEPVPHLSLSGIAAQPYAIK